MHPANQDIILSYMGGVITDLRKDLALEPQEHPRLKVENDCLVYLKEELKRDMDGRFLKAILQQASEEDFLLEHPFEILFSDMRIRRTSYPRRQCIRVLAHFFHDCCDIATAELGMK